MGKPAVPVIMYHSIGIPNRNWQWNYLTCPYNFFENQLRWMVKTRFHTISLQQLYDYMKKGIELPKNPIVLTFDDGYLDNWVFAYPLLKKYGFKGTIFVNPEFVDKRNVIRKNFEDLWRKDIEIDELDPIGYLSWHEMKEMESEGIIDIQSHTMTHTWYPVSDKIIDFRNPDDSHIWMTWNDNPTKKPFLQIDNKDLVSYGKPVYENARAIGCYRYFPDGDLRNCIIEYVCKRGDKNFFKSVTWRAKLFNVVKKYKASNRVNGRYETEEEYENRINYELQKSKKIIESKLNKKVNFLCWPGGVVTEKALKKAFDVNYISSIVGKKIKHKKQFLRNRYGEDSSRINRIDPVLYWNGIEGFGSKIKYKNGFLFVLSLYNFQGRKIIAPISRIVLVGMIRLYFFRFFFKM